METVAVTGTEHPTPRMIELLEEALVALPRGTRVVSGGCIGVDTEAGKICMKNGIYFITVFPADHRKVATINRYRSQETIQMPEGTTYRDRNIRVVDMADWVIAVPEGPTNGVDRGSGTWMTVRIARRAEKVVVVLEGW